MNTQIDLMDIIRSTYDRSIEGLAIHLGVDYNSIVDRWASKIGTDNPVGVFFRPPCRH